MSDLTYEHIAALDDPSKPWRRVWRTPTGFYVKTHARRRAGELGKMTWDITASQCDANGKALKRDDGSAAILGGDKKPFRRLFKVAPDADPATLEPIAVRLNRAVLFVVALAENAARNELDCQELL